MAYFSYNYSSVITTVRESVAVLYHHYNGDNHASLENIIEDLSNRRLSPTRILIVCGYGEQELIHNALKRLSATSRERLSIITHLKILPYDIEGTALVQNSIDFIDKGPKWSVSDKDLGDIAISGMKDLIKRTGVQMRAPFGYVFRKPSGGKLPLFIRAGNMFKEPEGLAVTIHLLMRNIPHRVGKIYIDSFTILSATLALQKYRASIAAACEIDYKEASIINFHSYEKSPELRFPADSDYRILISASTSGKLARELVSEHGAKHGLINHLLYFSTGTEVPEGTIYEESVDRHETDNTSKKIIDIPGEEFLVSYGKPHVVNIYKKHVCKNEGEAYKDAYYQSSFKLNLSAPDYKSYSLIDILDDDIDFPDAYTKWIQSLVDYEIAANTSCIVTTSDTKDCRLSGEFASRLKACLGRTIPILKIRDIANGIPESVQSPIGTVLVVAAQGRMGEELLSVSRSLRNIPHGHRHYIIGHFFPESYDDYDFLRKTLCVSGNERKYSWSTYQVTPIGSKDWHDSWSKEQNFSSGDATTVQEPLDFLKDRQSMLRKPQLSDNELFLPSLSTAALKIRSESVIFTGEYDPESISQVTVYILISAVLQRAREHRDAGRNVMPPDHCFYGNPFLSSVLNPSTFTRYNDGIIQAAFLRACAPDELNYASCKILSSQMTEVLISSIEHCMAPTGEAVLEMILALHTKRMRLCENDWVRVKERMQASDQVRPYYDFLANEFPL